MPFTCGRCRTEHETLDERYADDPVLLRLHERNLPHHGWAGRLDCTEREYMRRSRGGSLKRLPDEFSASVRDA